MFGYIRPLQGELKVYELERFKACYCGLCHALGKRYGLAARFVLNYELVFLVMLLWGRADELDIKRGLCIASPCRKKSYCAGNEAFDMCAGYSVILAWWKLRDTIADEAFLKTIPHRLASLVISGAYKKAAREFTGFDGKAREEIAALTEYEKGFSKSLDGAADKFAGMLTAAIPESMQGNDRRVMKELLYHTGRWIYIIDAYDDYKDDLKTGRYNAVAARFSTDEPGSGCAGELPDVADERLRTTLSHSNNLLCAAFELLPENVWTRVVANIIYMGMPYACDRVLEGAWPPPRSRGNKKIGTGI